MTDKINGRTPEEIKKGLWCCGNGDVSAHCGNCPYNRGTGDHGCIKELNADALALIQQLEADKELLIQRIGKDCVRIRNLMYMIDSLIAAVLIAAFIVWFAWFN